MQSADNLFGRRSTQGHGRGGLTAIDVCALSWMHYAIGVCMCRWVPAVIAPADAPDKAPAETEQTLAAEVESPDVNGTRAKKDKKSKKEKKEKKKRKEREGAEGEDEDDELASVRSGKGGKRDKKDRKAKKAREET